MKKNFSLPTILTALLLVAGINQAAELQALPFNDDMVDIQLNAGEITRSRPEGTVPVGSAEVLLLDKLSAQQLQNPVRTSPESLIRGAYLYRVNCYACHGNIGSKDYRPGVAGTFMGAPDVSHEMFHSRSDGQIFSTIRYGGVIMPPLGWKLSYAETWDIVNYVRQVQSSKQTESAPVPANAGAK